jgi:5-methylcytosine-specific restriction endonuclease McrA
MKIIKGKPRYEQTFFRFLEYYAQVKVVSLKRTEITKMAFNKLSIYDAFSPYIESGPTLENLYLFYSKFKNHDFLKEFFDYRKLRVNNKHQRVAYTKISSTPYHKFYETKEWMNLSTKVKKIYGKKCMKCGTKDSIIHTDHIVPRSLDLSRELDIHNMQVLCEFCNTEKSNLNCNDYRTEIDKLKLEAYLNKEVFIDPAITFKSWLDCNIKKLGKKQVEILIELWNKRDLTETTMPRKSTEIWKLE